MAIDLRKKLHIVPILIYLPFIFILTHIPIPEVVRKAHVSDKILHFIAYLILAWILWFAVCPGKKVSWRKSAAWWVLAAGIFYGILDEVIQGWVGRSNDIHDFFTDVAGIVTAMFILTVLKFRPALLWIVGIIIFFITNVARVNPAQILPAMNMLFHFLGYGVFAIIWIMVLNEKGQKKLSLKWLAISLLFPVVFLGFVKYYSFLAGRAVNLSDIIIALTGIAAAAVIA